MTTEPNEQKPRYSEKLFVMRPPLAMLLIQAGCEYTKAPHPWHDGWSSWTFVITDTVKEVAIPFYREHNMKIPRCLLERGKSVDE